MFKNLQTGIKSLENYVTSKEIREGSEKNYHLIQANQTMNKAYSNLPDDRFMIASDSYLKNLQEYWDDENEGKSPDAKVTLNIHHTVSVKPN